jgi:hypothetical protein
VVFLDGVVRDGAMKSRAAVMRRTGGPEVLRMEDVTLAPLRDGEIRLRAVTRTRTRTPVEATGVPRLTRATRAGWTPGARTRGVLAGGP